MSSNDLSININLAGLTSAAQRSLQRAMNLVAVGLNAVGEIEKLSVDLPDAISIRFASNEPWSTDKTRDEWTRWILVNGFRDAAESINTILEEARAVLAVWDLEKKQEHKALCRQRIGRKRSTKAVVGSIALACQTRSRYLRGNTKFHWIPI